MTLRPVANVRSAALKIVKSLILRDLSTSWLSLLQSAQAQVLHVGITQRGCQDMETMAFQDCLRHSVA